MLAQPGSVTQRPPAYLFSILFLVWFLVFIVATLVTLILPESYASRALIKVSRDISDIQGRAGDANASSYPSSFIRTQWRTLWSETVFNSVIDRLELNRAWGNKYNAGQALRRHESLVLLRSLVNLRPVRNTSLFEISVYGDDAAEAALLANTIADAYREHRHAGRRKLTLARIGVLEKRLTELEQNIQPAPHRAETSEVPGKNGPLHTGDQGREELHRMRSALAQQLAAERVGLETPQPDLVKVLRRAIPPVDPVRPNLPLNIRLGIFVGLISGFVLATVVFALQRLAGRRALVTGQIQMPPRIRAIAHLTIAFAAAVAIGYRCAAYPDFTDMLETALVLVLGGCASAGIESIKETAATPSCSTEPLLPSKY